MEKKEIKKRSKTPIVLVIIALLAVAGFCYYKFVWLPEDLAKYEIAEETPVETKVVGEVLKHGKNKKIIIFKHTPKKHSKKKQGHRQPYTKVEIKKIQA